MGQVVGTEHLPRGEIVEWKGKKRKIWDGDDRPPAPMNPSLPCCWAMRSNMKDRCTNLPYFNGTKYTRCRMHGGTSTGPKGGTQQTSKLAGRRIHELASALENDQGLTSIEEQVKLAAATLAEYMNQLEADQVEELDAKQLDGLLGRIEKVSKLIERRHKIREGQLYTVRSEHVVLIVSAVGEAINTELADHPELRERLARRIGRLRVIEGEAKRLPAAAENP